MPGYQTFHLPPRVPLENQRRTLYTGTCEISLPNIDGNAWEKL